MGYSWVYVGDGAIPDDAAARWRASSASPAPHAEVLATADLRGWNLHDPEQADNGTTVGDVLEFLADEDGARVEIHAGRIVVRVLADKSMDAWLTYRAPLAAAFVTLREFGGNGTLRVVGFDDGPDDGFVVVSDREGARARTLVPAEIAEVREGEGYREVGQLFDAFVRGAHPELFDDDGDA
jgi:hypothetical protein